MRVSYLELKNYRRFRELKLQFPDGIVGILGLNGVGKTTIIESIAWALFGNVEEVVRTSREGVRRSGAGSSDSCTAVLEFELGDAEYRIEREMGGRSLSTRAELKSKGNTLAEGDKPVRKMVEKLLGMDHKSFFTSVFARQKELNALQNVAAGERKKVVLRMLRIDGIDTVLADLRSDRRDTLSRIEGAERTLLTEDGREKEKVLEDKIPELIGLFDEASRSLQEAEQKEELEQRDFELAKKRRDELKRDLEAYNASSSDLKAKQSAIKELVEREKSIATRIANAEVQLRNLPALEKSEAEWKLASERKDALEREKGRFEKAKSIKEEVESEAADLENRMTELDKLKAGLENPEQIESQASEVEKAMLESEALRAEISSNMGEIKARIAEKKHAAAKDREKLEEIRCAGSDGVCPTCERKLDDAFELLVSKFEESSAQAEKQAEEAKTTLDKLGLDLQALIKKDEALKRRRTKLDQDRSRIKQLEASISAKSTELDRLIARIAQRKKSLAEMGEISFSENEYKKARIEHEKLKLAHDEFTRLKSLAEQMKHYAHDLESVGESIKRGKTEEQTLGEIVKALEPKKSLYDFAIKELDAKTTELNVAKDTVRKSSSAKDRAHSELERTQAEMEEVKRVKKSIENDRKTADDLALLEDVVVNFKDNLIGRVAPALSELTSKGLVAMTEGKYSRVELDENYEMQIDDQGTMYPVSRFSGGEADLANLSLRLAISGIIADRTGASPVNILILDEIFGSQDLNRKKSVMTALSRLSTQFRQIFLITHIEDVKDAMNYVIQVEEQEDGTSRAALVN